VVFEGFHCVDDMGFFGFKLVEDGDGLPIRICFWRALFVDVGKQFCFDFCEGFHQVGFVLLFVLKFSGNPMKEGFGCSDLLLVEFSA